MLRLNVILAVFSIFGGCMSNVFTLGATTTLKFQTISH